MPKLGSLAFETSKHQLNHKLAMMKLLYDNTFQETNRLLCNRVG